MNEDRRGGIGPGRRHRPQRLALYRAVAAGKALLVAAALIVSMALPTLSVAQPRYVRLTGWVQWIAGEKLMLVADGWGSIPVDLTRVPLDEYRTLQERDYVAVTGVVSEDNRGIEGVSVQRIPDWYSWEQQSP